MNWLQRGLVEQVVTEALGNRGAERLAAYRKRKIERRLEAERRAVLMKLGLDPDLGGDAALDAVRAEFTRRLGLQEGAPLCLLSVRYFRMSPACGREGLPEPKQEQMRLFLELADVHEWLILHLPMGLYEKEREALQTRVRENWAQRHPEAASQPEPDGPKPLEPACARPGHDAQGRPVPDGDGIYHNVTMHEVVELMNEGRLPRNRRPSGWPLPPSGTF